jgi:hypothetical protein
MSRRADSFIWIKAWSLAGSNSTRSATQSVDLAYNLEKAERSRERPGFFHSERTGEARNGAGFYSFGANPLRARRSRFAFAPADSDDASSAKHRQLR